jgi:ABC-type cobalamin/Fe3+-siderophores transport system ATPase subunit
MTLGIEVAGLRLRYRDVTALDDLSFTLPGGRIYGLLGRNGSGKTSLLSVLAGFRKASGGTVLIDGQPVFENPGTPARSASSARPATSGTGMSASVRRSTRRAGRGPAGTATTRTPWSTASRSRDARSWASCRSGSARPWG